MPCCSPAAQLLVSCRASAAWSSAQSNSPLSPPCTPPQYDLPVTLEELALGCTKQVTHCRKVLTELGELLREQRSVTVHVRPGMRDGTSFVFEG
jgi:hypothetical protein